MKPRHIAAAAAFSAMLSSCASAPEKIAPSKVSTQDYASLTCQQLGEEEARVKAAYEVAAEEQRKTRKSDEWGVFWLGLPLGSMSGKDAEQKIADLKGQLNAILEVEIQKSCNSVPPSNVPATAPQPAP